jgi:hypothetical protein
MALDLVNISNATQVSNAIHAPLSSPVKHAIAATVLSLAEIHRAFDNDGSLSTFLPDNLLLLPPRTQGAQAPSTDQLQYMCDLTSRAANAAESLSCSSILAGQGSESDYTGDVALWLGEGDYGPGCEKNVLALLELTPWLEQGANVSWNTIRMLLRLSLRRWPGYRCQTVNLPFRPPCWTVQKVPMSKIS